MITVYAGYDPRESLAYHVFCQSILNKCSEPVAFIPLHQPMLSGFDGQRDGTNAFIFSRFLVPYLSGFNGWALFVDGDHLFQDDLAKLWALRDERYAVQVVKHDYKTSCKRKYVGSPIENDNVDYPQKNWSSVVLWNCAHPSNRILTREFVTEAGGQFLHRFHWLKDEEVGALPLEWNYLVREPNQSPGYPKLVHYTLGIPGFHNYQNDPFSYPWHKAALDVVNVVGEDPVDLIQRAKDHANAVF